MPQRHKHKRRSLVCRSRRRQRERPVDCISNCPRYVRRTRNDLPQIERKAPTGIAGDPQAAREVRSWPPSRKRYGSHKRQVVNRLGSEEYVSLKDKKGLIVGIANRNSIAYGCAEVLHSAGAELAVTYLDAKAEPFVRPLAEQLGSSIVVPCNVREPGQLEAVFSRIRNEWGRL